MFVLSRLESLVALPPHNWSHPLPDALKMALNKKLANTVVHKLGLVVGVFDLLNIGQSFLFPGDGAHHTKVVFRVVVFKPFVEEVLVGKVKSCNLSMGVTVSLGFFDDVIIPPEALQHPYRFDNAEQVWVWEYPTEEGSHDLYVDPGESVRIRVTAETFCESFENEDKGSSSGGGVASVCEEEEKKKRTPYLIHASMNEPGLGLLKWWE